jgi:hypothetical protein
MAKFFPKLTQTTVFIQTDEKGNGFDCPMLPIGAMNEIDKLSSELRKAADAQDLIAIGDVRKKMIELAKTVIPEQYHENMFRLDVEKCVELLAYLMYGDPNGDDQKPEKEEKN